MKIGVGILVFLVAGKVFGQVNVEQNNWHNTDPVGLHTEKAYVLLANKPSTSVLVAVIDSGVDCEHEDLVGKIVDDVEKGYYLHDKVIRYAKVVVGQ